jgi:trigger factor
MNVEVEQLGPVKKKINVTIPPETVTEEIASTYQKLKQTVKIRGFRPGKVPQDILEKYYKEHVEGEVITRLIQHSYPEALKKLDILPVSQPVVENGVLEEGKAFLYSASFEVKPEIALQEYTGLSVTRGKCMVTPEDVEKRLAFIQESHASLKEVEEDRPIEQGDFIVADLEEAVGGASLEGGNAKDYLLEVGKDSYLPGLSQKLIGLRKNGVESITVTVPEDYPRKEIAGKEVTVNITLKGLKKKILPELDDAFARDLGEELGIEALKKKLKTDLEQEEKQRIESEVRGQLVDQLIEKNPLEAPTYMVERQIEFMMADTQRALLAQGSSLEKLGMSLEVMKERYRSEAEKQVKCSLLVEVISEKAGIEVNDSEVEEKIEEIAQANNQDIATVSDFYRKEGLWEGLKIKLLEKKTLNFLLEKAMIIEADTETTDEGGEK